MYKFLINKDYYCIVTMYGNYFFVQANVERTYSFLFADGVD